jgi:hypothetical protein
MSILFDSISLDSILCLTLLCTADYDNVNISDLKKGKSKDSKKDAGRSKSKRDKNVSYL